MARFRQSYQQNKPTYRPNPNYTPRSVRHIEHRARNRIIITIVAAITIGVFLITWGLPAFIHALSVFNKLKPNADAVSPASQGAAIAPPTLNIPFDATNSATIAVSGYSTPNTKVEVYFDDQLEDTATVGDDGTFTTKQLNLSLGQNNIYGKTVDTSGQKSLPSKTIQLTFNNQKPNLEVDSPSDGTHIQGGDKKVTVSGKTDPSDVITINGVTSVVNSDGTFSKSIGINDGDNTITIVSTDSIGNTTQVQKTVNYSGDSNSSPSPTPSS